MSIKLQLFCQNKAEDASGNGSVSLRFPDGYTHPDIHDANMNISLTSETGLNEFKVGGTYELTLNKQGSPGL